MHETNPQIDNAKEQQYEDEDEESIEIVGAVKLMDGLFLGDAICAEVCSK